MVRTSLNSYENLVFDHILTLAGVPYALGQFCGMTILAMFLVNIFEETGTDFDPFYLSIFCGIIRLVCSMLSTVFLKRLVIYQSKIYMVIN